MTLAAPVSHEMRPLRIAASVIGLVIVALALPFVLLAGGPLNGWILGALLWIANWSVALWMGRLTTGLEPTYAVGLAGISFIARAWLVAGVLFVVALRYSEPIALTAAGVFIFAFTFDLFGRTILFSINEKLRRAEAAE